MKRTIALVAALVAIGFGAYAQQSLAKSPSLPKVDGAVAAGEYQYEGSKDGMKLYATLGEDGMVYLAVVAPSSGWAGIGVGGLIMNGSRLFMAAVQGGKPAMIEKAGMGHFYVDAKDQVAKSWAVKTVGDVTTFELSLPATAAVWKGKINTTWAFSRAPDFTKRHQGRAALSFDVK